MKGTRINLSILIKSYTEYIQYSIHKQEKYIKKEKEKKKTGSFCRLNFENITLNKNRFRFVYYEVYLVFSKKWTFVDHEVFFIAKLSQYLSMRIYLFLLSNLTIFSTVYCKFVLNSEIILFLICPDS